MTDAEPLFRFVQLEFAWPLGPDDGRYVIRADPDGSPGHVLVLATLGAPQRRALGRRRARAAAPEPPPEPVATGRATVIDAERADGEEAARAWLSEQRGERAEATVDAAVAVLNRALHAHRLAAADPFVNEVTGAQALTARAGFGRGEQVADGRWLEAVVLAPARGGRARRAAALRPQERLAALLGARERALACEELVLRARLDLDSGRLREAALQTRVALEAALAELAADADVGDLATRLDDLRARRGAIGDAANAALAGDLPPAGEQAVRDAVERLGAALRARSARLAP
jgi:hypothetical protein